MSGNGPDLFGSILDKGKNIFDSVMGFFGEHKAIEASAIAGAMDMALGDGFGGTAVGMGAAAMFEKEGAPPWLAGLGGIIVGGLSSNHSFLGAIGVAILGVAINYAKKFFNHDGPAPSLAPSHP